MVVIDSMASMHSPSRSCWGWLDQVRDMSAPEVLVEPVEKLGLRGGDLDHLDDDLLPQHLGLKLPRTCLAHLVGFPLALPTNRVPICLWWTQGSHRLTLLLAVLFRYVEISVEWLRVFAVPTLDPSSQRIRFSRSADPSRSSTSRIDAHRSLILRLPTWSLFSGGSGSIQVSSLRVLRFLFLLGLRGLAVSVFTLLSSSPSLASPRWFHMRSKEQI